MPLFSRRRTAAPEPAPATWMPLHSEPVSLSGDAAHMDDDGQALPFAYRVAFGLPGRPDGPVITVCTYVSHGATEGTYSLGLRYAYTNETKPGWSYTGWTAHPDGSVYHNAAEANGDASWWAYWLLTAGDADVATSLPMVFDWAGGVF